MTDLADTSVTAADTSVTVADTSGTVADTPVTAAADVDGVRIAAAMAQLLRRWWLVLGGAALGAALAVAVVSVGVVPSTATATLGLTEAVGWPDYDRDRQEQATAAGPIVDAYVASHGLTAASLDLATDDPLLIRVVVEAGSVGEAAEAANALADEIADRSAEVVAERLDDEIAALDVELAVFDRELADLTEQQDALIDDEAATRQAVYGPDVTAATRAELERLEAARLPVDTAIYDLTQVRSELAAQRMALVTRIDAERPILSLISPASAVDPRERNPVTVGLLGAVVGAVLAGAAVLSWLPRR